MNNKSWKTLYEEIVQKIQKIDAEQKKEVENQIENINTMINNIQSLKNELIQQLENQEVEDIDKNAKIRDLIKRIEDIEGGSGSGECPDYNSFFEKAFHIDTREIVINHFNGHGFKGNFPPFDVEYIEEDAFKESEFTGEFPLIENLIEIEDNAFENSQFTGKFPPITFLRFIGHLAFYDSKFTGEFPSLMILGEVGFFTFYNSEFTGEFPSLISLTKVWMSAFYNSKFTGEFPLLENLIEIEADAFYNSNFDKDENGFVKNYPGWDGKAAWKKPSSYRAAMKDIDAPKLMSIIPPGAGEIQVLNEEAKLAQSIRRDEYLEENEPSDIDYYISYTEKLKEIGFERDEYGNYVDVVNDKSVIIIPEDIKFLV